MPEGTILGHMHLHVRDIPEAEQFYRDVLGFDLIQRYGATAAFLSLNGYHHHIGVNTWAGVGAPAPPKNVIGLQWFKLKLPDAGMIKRLKDASWPFEELAHGVRLKDPSGNGLLLDF